MSKIVVAGLLAIVLFYGLSRAWMALGVLKFAMMVILILGIGWLWGKLS